MTTRPLPLYLLVLDFEATCDRIGFPLHRQEIIEFPTLIYNIKERKVEATFSEYETVDEADMFPEVWERFNEFLTGYGVFENPDSFAFLTCGAWDLVTMLPKQLNHEADRAVPAPLSITLPPPFDRVIDLIEAFSAFYKMERDRDMDEMLEQLHLDLQGRHHSGIDDCKNIVRIVRKMLDDGWQPEVTAVV
ncbi:ERI1 exoribonuclease 3 [Tulasnella sp. 332]|nr:ERI1 exoribonuclease 3 [Tulasnella sp. 332]